MDKKASAKYVHVNILSDISFLYFQATLAASRQSSSPSNSVSQATSSAQCTVSAFTSIKCVARLMEIITMLTSNSLFVKLCLRLLTVILERFIKYKLELI